jgi:glycosyltransferase involved in cell wall biosynthesis
MRILFIHEVNYIQKPIFEMHEFPEWLAHKGHDVGFFHFPEGFSYSQVKSLGWKKKIKGRVVRSIDITLFTPQLSSGSLVGRLLHFVFARVMLAKSITDFQPEIIVSYSVPTSGWQATKLAKRRKIPIVFRAIDVPHKIRARTPQFFIKSIERIVYKSSDWISANNQALLDYCCELSKRTGSCSVDYPPLNLEHFRRKSFSKLPELNRSFPPESRILVYVGTFFYFSGLPQVIREFGLRRMPGEYLLLVGGGEQNDSLNRLVLDLGLKEWVVFTGFVPYENLNAYLSVASVAINPMLRSLVSDKAFPNKVIQYVAAQMPVSTTRLSSLEAIFSESDTFHFSDSPEQVLSTALDMARKFGPHPPLVPLPVGFEDKFAVVSSLQKFEDLLFLLVKIK